jgi:uncharacterized protein
MLSRRPYLASLLVVVVAACSDPSVARSRSSASLALRTAVAATRADDPAMTREYGPAMAVGNGIVRTYVVIDKDGGAPLEVGVAMSESALEGLPKPTRMAHNSDNVHEHLDSHVYDLPMPAKNPTPYKFVELDWNPGGHEPPTVYDTAHFDFHFYRVDKTVRDAIDPTLVGEAQFVVKSGNLPPEAQRSPFFQALAAPGAPIMAVPRMGTHWVDVRTPELQRLLGQPDKYRPFSTTFLHGSWDGQFIFDEPMITRAFILGRKTAIGPAQRDSVIALPVAQRHSPAGYYPSAYRINYDSRTKEYIVALTQLAKRD